MKSLILNILLLIAGSYIVICALLYFFQERMIFFPEKLEKDYVFSFNQKFEEINVKAGDGALINGLLFKADSSKGLIFYLHGNAGSLRSWGRVAAAYTGMNYDVFILDYRGYGKSEGTISSEEQFYGDVQCAYDEIKKRYSEGDIIVIGYSIGSAPAAKLASTNNPAMLILQAPFYNMWDIVKQRLPVIPPFLLKYKFPVNEFVKNSKMQVIIFHGDRDEVIYYGSSLKLKNEFKPQDTLITLSGQTHNGMTDNPDYLTAVRKILEK